MSSSILVIHTSFLGDSVLVLPFVQELRKIHPSADIDIITSPRGEPVFSASPVFRQVYCLEKSGRHKSLTATIQFARTLKKNNYSIVYSLHRSFRTSLIVRMLGVKETYGFANANMSFVYRHKVPYNREAHEVQRLLAFLGNGNIPAEWRIRPEIDSTGSAGIITNWLNDNRIKEGFIAVAPGSVWATKRYPENNFIGVIQKIQSDGTRVVLLGSKAEKEVCERIAAATDALNACDAFSIPAVKELLSRSRLLITNDSALTHIGMSAGCRVLTIYCSTVPAFGFYPYMPGSGVVELTELSCKPCGIHGHMECPEKHFACGNELTPETVIRKAEELING